jgi:hypothetical protein
LQEGLAERSASAPASALMVSISSRVKLSGDMAYGTMVPFCKWSERGAERQAEADVRDAFAKPNLIYQTWAGRGRLKFLNAAVQERAGGRAFQNLPENEFGVGKTIMRGGCATLQKYRR